MNRHSSPSDPRARSAEIFLRIDKAVLRRNIGPLLLVAVLFVLTLNDMPVARALARAGIPVFLVRLPIAIFGAVYYLPVLFATVEALGSLLKKKFYNRHPL
ncbi:MAG TPA: hypothetical protein VN841_05405 [Bryobacteraceae bacterium]|nr:hypothetical protein [Bryobacteraceae bacterium]